MACRLWSKPSWYLQSHADSQFSELLSQSQTQLPAEGADEGEIERELRSLNERVIETQQELMTAQAACRQAQEAEAEAHCIWEAKRCFPSFASPCL